MICAKVPGQALESICQFAKNANIFLGTILTSSKNGAPFPDGFSEKGIVFMSGGIAYDLSTSLLSKQSLPTDLLIFIICTENVKMS